MKLEIINEDFSICKVADYSQINLESSFCFIQKTDEENSLVCLTKDVPNNITARDDGWVALKIDDILNFNLVGILSKISTLLANENISIFALSTFNTDYILLYKQHLPLAIETLEKNGYQIMKGE